LQAPLTQTSPIGQGLGIVPQLQTPLLLQVLAVAGHPGWKDERQSCRPVPSPRQPLVVPLPEQGMQPPPLQ
jgi:hypothetical protein